MSLVRIANFSDLTEAQVVTSALRSADILVMLQNEVWGQMYWTNQQAVGGFAVWVPEDEVDAARAIIAVGRQFDPAALDWMAQPNALAQAPVALGGALLGGWSYAAFRRGRTPLRWAVLLLSASGLLVVIAMMTVGQT